MEQHTAQSQGEDGDLQQLGGVEDPALANLAVRHVLQNEVKVWQDEDVEDGGGPQEGGEKYVDKESGCGGGGM